MLHSFSINWLSDFLQYFLKGKGLFIESRSINKPSLLYSPIIVVLLAITKIKVKGGDNCKIAVNYRNRLSIIQTIFGCFNTQLKITPLRGLYTMTIYTMKFQFFLRSFFVIFWFGIYKYLMQQHIQHEENHSLRKTSKKLTDFYKKKYIYHDEWQNGNLSLKPVGNLSTVAA